MSCKICGRTSCTESFHSIQEQEDIEKIQSDRAVDLLAKNKKLQKAIAIADNENEARCGLMNIMRSELIIREAEIKTLKQQRDDLLAAAKLTKKRLLTHGEWDEGCFYYAGHSASELQEPLKLIEAAIVKCET